MAGFTRIWASSFLVSRLASEYLLIYIQRKTFKKEHLKISERRSRWDDARQNSWRIPDGERVEIPAIWLVEVFTPSNQSQLRYALRRLGWDRQSRFEQDTVIEFLDDMRSSSAPRWLNVGVISPPGGYDVAFVDHYSPLPDGVSFLTARLHWMGPSTTAIMIGFHLDPELRSSLMNTLRRDDYTSFIRSSLRPKLFPALKLLLTATGRSRLRASRDLTYTSEVGPARQREKEINERQEEIFDRCKSWMRKYFKGEFSTGLLEGLYPAAKLLVTDMLPPFSGDYSLSPMQHLNYASGWGVIENVITPELRLKAPSSEYQATKQDQITITFGFRRSDSVKLGFDIDPDADYVNELISRHVADHLAPGALSCTVPSNVLLGFEGRLARYRDALARYHGAGRETTRQLRELRSDISARLGDMQAALSDMRIYADLQKNSILKKEIAKWRPVKDGGSNYLEAVRGSLSDRADTVARSLNEYLGRVGAVASLSSATGQFRVAIYALVVAIISLFAAMLSLLVAALAIDSQKAMEAFHDLSRLL